MSDAGFTPKPDPAPQPDLNYSAQNLDRHRAHRAEDDPTRTPSAASAARPVVAIAGREYPWPTPERYVDVAGRRLAIDTAVVAALYAVVGLWLLWELHSVVTSIGGILGGLFSSSSFAFVLSWIVAVVLAVVLYVVAALLYTAYALFRLDPVGRGLSAVLFTVLALLLFTSVRSWTLFMIALVAGLCCAVLYLSPWSSAAFAASPVRRQRPGAVVTATVLAVSYFSVTALFVLLSLPGLRYAGDLGVRYILFVLCGAGACVAVFAGLHMLRPGPNRQGRVLVTIGSGVIIVGQVSTGSGPSIVTALGIAAGIVAPLWVSEAARRWFGDQPLDQAKLLTGHGLTAAAPGSPLEAPEQPTASPEPDSR